MKSQRRTTLITKTIAVIIAIVFVGCSQYSAPVDTNIRISSQSISNLMANPQHIIIGGLHQDEHWVDTIDPKDLKFNKSLSQGEWIFFGRMFIGNKEYCTVQNANLQTEAQDINLDFSKSACSKSPISSTGLNQANIYFCEDIQNSSAQDCINQTGDTKSFQFDFYKTGTSGLTGNPYFTSECYTLKNGQALIDTPFYLQTAEDISLPGKIKMFKGVDCNGLSSEIEFEYFLSENEKIKSDFSPSTPAFYVYDASKNKARLDATIIAEVGLMSEEEQEEVVVVEEEQEEVIVTEEEQVGKNEKTETQTSNIKIEIDLLASNLTITEIETRGRHTINYGHQFLSQAELFKIVIKKVGEKTDSSTKIKLPDLTNDYLFSFENDEIEIYLGDYIQAGTTFVEFNIQAIGPKAEDEKLIFKFYELEK